MSTSITYRENALKTEVEPSAFQRFIARFQWSNWEIRCERHPVTIVAMRDEDYNYWFCHMFLTRTNKWETESYHLVSDHGLYWRHRNSGKIIFGDFFKGLNLTGVWKHHKNVGKTIYFNI
jgi:hypothetical protein